MLIARVTGNIVSTQKHADYAGQKLLILRALNEKGRKIAMDVFSGLFCASSCPCT